MGGGRMRKRLLVVVALTVVGLTACDNKRRELNEAKRMPKAPPPTAVVIPADLRIAVEIDGREAPPLDAAVLSSKQPDFADTDRRAWRMDALLGEPAEREGVVIAVTGEHNVTIELTRPADPRAGPIPVLTVSR